MSTLAGMRWWISPPAPDETLRSVLERAAAFYHWEPERLWQELNSGDLGASGTIDQPSSRALIRLGQALGMSAVQLRQHRVPDAAWRLDPAARRAICPICWELPAPDGQPELRSWTRVLRTRCPTHDAPLCLPVSRHHAGTDASKLEVLTPEDREVLRLIETFGTAVEASLFFGTPWPANWRCDVREARRLLVEVSTYTGEGSGHALIANVSPSATLTPFIHGWRHLLSGEGRRDWEWFRQVVDPAVRRAALWAVAWELVPDLPGHLSPGWVINRNDTHDARQASH